MSTLICPESISLPASRVVSFATILPGANFSPWYCREQPVHEAQAQDGGEGTVQVLHGGKHHAIVV